MKQFFAAFSLLILSLMNIVSAQNEVILTINHKLADQNFAMNMEAKNNMNHAFNINRLEYYISEISVIHDGGTETLVEDLWVLANARNTTEANLGQYAINEVEAVKFHIGVDPDHNHLDPASWPSAHPLAPTAPSMHWGWAAGYRFVALEGNGGSNLNQSVQLHGLGDANYFTTTIEISALAENNVVSINLDADYTRALENIALNSGVIVHGETMQAKRCLENFRDYVFSPASISSNTMEVQSNFHFEITPNPISQGIARLHIGNEHTSAVYDLTIRTIDGKVIHNQRNVRHGESINVAGFTSGTYVAVITQNGLTVGTQQLLVY